MGETVRRLTNGVQNYAWGKVGAQSLVTAFLPEFEESKPYAELWVGTHPSLESFISSSRLSSITGSLPYLLKVLSVAIPLSIQIHPNRAQAQRLHALNPVRYPDNNHKPELCVALTRMEILCGLKGEEEAQRTVSSIREMSEVLGGETGARQQVARLLRDEEETRRLTRKYLERSQACQDQYAKLARALHAHFPADVGIFFALLMNHITLEPGEAVYIDAGVPHAYLSGDCIEAQACSDNVVRCGLTPKPKDPATLLDLLSIEKIGRPTVIRPDSSAHSLLFPVPCEDFALWKVVAPGRIKCCGPTCVLVVEGEGALVGETTRAEIRRGDSCLLVEDAEVTGSAVVYACMRGTGR